MGFFRSTSIAAMIALTPMAVWAENPFQDQGQAAEAQTTQLTQQVSQLRMELAQLKRQMNESENNNNRTQAAGEASASSSDIEYTNISSFMQINGRYYVRTESPIAGLAYVEVDKQTYQEAMRQHQKITTTQVSK